MSDNENESARILLLQLLCIGYAIGGPFRCHSRRQCCVINRPVLPAVAFGERTVRTSPITEDVHVLMAIELINSGGGPSRIAVFFPAEPIGIFGVEEPTQQSISFKVVILIDGLGSLGGVTDCDNRHRRPPRLQL